LPLELHEQIGGYILGGQPVRLDQILGYVLVSKNWSQTIFSGPIRLVAFNKHRISIDLLEGFRAFDRLSFCLDLRYCQRLGDDEKFLRIMQFHNIYELDLRGMELKYHVDPSLGQLTSLRRLAISQYRSKNSSCYDFISKLTNLNSLIIQQDGDATRGIFKLDLQNLEPLTNLQELAIQPYNECHAIIEPVTKLVSLKALILNCGFSTQNEPTSPDAAQFTALTNLQVLAMRGIGYKTEREAEILQSIEWQTSLKRIYYRGLFYLPKMPPIWHDLPIEKFKVGETLFVEVFNSTYKVNFY
jgi:hypothetical protein